LLENLATLFMMHDYDPRCKSIRNYLYKLLKILAVL
jgi:hypothetical protein